MKVRYDADYLYIGAKYFQSLTWATIKGHNDLLTAGEAPFGNDDFEVFLDAPGCYHGYKELEMKAFNTVWNLMLDKTYNDGGSEHGGFGDLPPPCPLSPVPCRY